MPQPQKYAPDWVDVQNLLARLGEDFGLVVYFQTRLRNDKVECIGKAYGAPYTGEGTPTFLALVSWPIKQQKDVATAFYTLAFDIWCQADGAGATAAKRGAPHGWNGRVETLRRRTAQ